MELKLVEVQGKDFLENIANGRKITEKHLAEALETASRRLWKGAIDTTPRSTGNLAKSITRDLHPTYARIYPQLKYGLYVHEGTDPHWVPKKELEPGGTLYRWAKKKGIPPFLVARAIAKRGTKAQPWLSDLAKVEWNSVREIFMKELDKAVKALVK